MQQLDRKRVRDYMSRNLVTFTPGTELFSAIHQLLKHRLSSASVVDSSGKLVGVLSEKDCLKVALLAGFDGSPAGLVEEFMTREAVTVDVDDNLLDIANRFIDSSFRRFPVTENGKLIGEIVRADILRAIDDAY